MEHYERNSTLENDIKLLQKIKENKRTAVIYRSERKKILHNQIGMIIWIISVIEKSENIQIEHLSQKFKDLYMKPMIFEIG